MWCNAGEYICWGCSIISACHVQLLVRKAFRQTLEWEEEKEKRTTVKDDLNEGAACRFAAKNKCQNCCAEMDGNWLRRPMRYIVEACFDGFAFANLPMRYEVEAIMDRRSNDHADMNYSDAQIVRESFGRGQWLCWRENCIPTNKRYCSSSSSL